MRNKSTDTVKGEAAMTDFQFKAYIELRDKYEAAVKELESLRKKGEIQAEIAAEVQAMTGARDDGMSDYQFQRYEKLRDKCEEMAHENALLREENAKLKVQAEMLKSLSGDAKGKKK